MDIIDALTHHNLDLDIKIALLRLAAEHNAYHAKILKPTATNDDVNGSQHVSNGGTDFTYEDVDLEDLQHASSLGYYEYFSDYFGAYTGHYYNGSGLHFEGIVVDPPTYAIDLVL